MKNSFPDHAQLANLSLIEDLYQKYLADPNSVDLSWRYFFQGIDFAGFTSHPTESTGSSLKIFLLIQAYRKFGHLAASFNPLEPNRPFPEELGLDKLGFSESDLNQIFPALGFCGQKEAPLKEIIASLQRIYTNKIGFEYMELGNPKLEEWLSERLEKGVIPLLSKEEKLEIWKSLVKTELLEQFFHRKYAGKTRFSLEGCETMIPLISSLLQKESDLGLEELLIGMAHRGRLNVLAQILEKPYSILFEEFEDDTILSYFGQDDVKYHMGFSKKISLPSGKKVDVSMTPNPSHLESVDPVVLGQVRALQVLKNDEKQEKIGALLIHGDASFAGQGVIYETLQLMNLPGYSIGGTLHLIVNNQIGYTTNPEESRSTRYSTDIAKAFGSPVFHVNAEDPESCLFAATLAVEIRQKFHLDVFIDLVGYRKYGHNEGDEPSYTQPVQYQLIHSKQSIRELYASQLILEGILDSETIEAFETGYKEELSRTLESVQEKPSQKPKAPEKSSLLKPVLTAVESSTLQKIAKTYGELPADFHLHPKLKKWLEDRISSVERDPAKPSIDWAGAECLAFGSLLLQNIPIRLAGEDSQRGTFSQRHLVLVDAQTNLHYSPLEKLGARLDVINTPLTEFAGMAFEYGYSWSNPKTAVLWEAQYGDFNNGGQIVIDQYLVSAEKKWNTPSSLTLLLPHAYEGAGPEHSSARLERFLQLAADENIQVVNASTPAQYFHLLRRQALRPLKKPLIVFTPKSLLRSPLTLSPLNDFTSNSFQEILDDPLHPSSASRLLLCSGKIYYELQTEREKRNLPNLALIRIEQLYPLHKEKLTQIFTSYPNISQICWVQEESENAGAWNYMRPLLQELFPNKAIVYIGRPENPTTATGSQKKHKQEQEALIVGAVVGALPQTPPKD